MSSPFRAFVFSFLALVGPAISQAADYRAPQNVAWEFCHFIDSSQRDIFSKRFYDLTTDSLLKAIRKAESKNSLIATTYPNAIPPMEKAMPYGVMKDHAPFCRVDDVTYQRRYGQAVISYIFPDTPEANWSDRLKLKNINGVWKIDDVIYGNGVHPTTLRQVLKDAFPGV